MKLIIGVLKYNKPRYNKESKGTKGTKGRNVLLAPPTKPFKDVYELAKISRGLSSMITYRDRLRDVLLEVVPVQWNKKCIEYVETQEGVFGADGINSPTTLVYSYPSELDNVESEKVKVDDNDPASVIKHVKRLIRTLRPDCELTNLLLELWDLAPKTIPNDPPFKTYNSIQRRMMRNIDPMSIKSWSSNRVVLLGDAAYAMSPILGLGANNAIQDADKLSQALLRYTDDNTSFIEEYEKEKRTSADHS
ncbi:16485_t:CDS:2 [Rhizophagus irregularis]|nr:16485_t:CDS:2 [Rhizophagus irregularis]